MRKYMIALLLVLSLLLCSLYGAQAGSLSRAEMYEALQQELRYYLDGDDAMPLELLVTRYNDLGNYRKSAFFCYYVSILRDTEQELFVDLPLYTELIRLDEGFCELLVESGFPSVDEVEAYALGRQAELMNDWPAAIMHYQKSIAVLDSVRRLAELRRAGPTATLVPVATAKPVATPTPTLVPTPVPDLITAKLSGTGDRRQIQVEANGYWWASGDSWIDLSVSSGRSGKTTIEVWLRENPSSSSYRTGVVTFTCGSKSCTVTIRQDPNPALYDSGDFWVGNTVEFGHYEQDGWSSNGKEAIRWRVLARSGSRALLFSDKVLDSKAYIDSYSSVSVTWSSSSLRTWLNGTFYQNAFSAAERDAVRKTLVSTPYISGYGSPGPDTQDNVFLLSYQECQQYLGNLVAYPTQYAASRGVLVRNDMGGATFWWLRSAHTAGKVCVINTSGRLYGSTTNDTAGGVRPAIWVDLSNSIFK